MLITEVCVKTIFDSVKEEFVLLDYYASYYLLMGDTWFGDPVIYYGCVNHLY